MFDTKSLEVYFLPEFFWWNHFVVASHGSAALCRTPCAILAELSVCKAERSKQGLSKMPKPPKTGSTCVGEKTHYESFSFLESGSGSLLFLQPGEGRNRDALMSAFKDRHNAAA